MERIALWLMRRSTPREWGPPREWGQSIFGDLEEEGRKRGPFNSIFLIFEVLRLSGRFLERVRESAGARPSRAVIRPRTGAIAIIWLLLSGRHLLQGLLTGLVIVSMGLVLGLLPVGRLLTLDVETSRLPAW